MKNVYTLTITVSPEDLDLLQHVNNLVYVKWMAKGLEKRRFFGVLC